MKKSSLVSILFAILAFPTLLIAQNNSVDSKEIQWEDLKNDSTRAALAYFEVVKYGPAVDRDVKNKFIFPDDAEDGIYGIDVSHHNGVVDWSKVAKVNAKFVYIKATQGDRFRDPKFEMNWSGSRKEKIPRGAYHFLKAKISGKDQAKAFLTMLDKVGGLQAEDLAPVLDLEWDLEKRNGEDVDCWGDLSSDEIAQIVLDWITAVKTGTGRTPTIYTAATWWKERMGSSLALKSYPQWLADYRKASINAGAPQSTRDHKHLAWQFTDGGNFEGATAKFDVNRLNGSDIVILMGK